ncbi:hypothetical protein [Streptomyces sp. NPDC057623]|uniref:hypothetical protein n=1 Tax=Streptomyces sp. NPDC057623 TaxID=3346187 RepID=UPI00369A50F2
MPERIHQPPDQPSPEPDLTPQPSLIVAEPATVQACQQDYADASDVRLRLGWTDGQS